VVTAQQWVSRRLNYDTQPPFFFIITIVLIASQAYVPQGVLFKQLAFVTSNTTMTATRETAEEGEESDPASTLSFPTNPTGNFNAAGSISSHQQLNTKCRICPRRELEPACINQKYH
jgi:hypothetical protein